MTTRTDDASVSPHFRSPPDGSGFPLVAPYDASTQLIEGKEITCCRCKHAESADLHHHTLSPLNFVCEHNEMLENRECFVLYDREEQSVMTSFSIHRQSVSPVRSFCSIPRPST